VTLRITILTPCFNGVQYVAEAIESVRRQAYPNLEHIVLDAGSTDGTLALLQRYPDLQVVSEPDEGAHDAMNKGIVRSTGEVIGFLNTDDTYADGVLAEVGRVFAADPTLDVAVGSSIVFEDACGARKPLVTRDHARDDGFWLPELAFGHPGFNGRFFRRRVFAQIGPFDNSYYIGADRHFLTRIALARLKAQRLQSVGIYYRHHAGSQTMNPERRLTEEIGREHVRMATEFLGATKRSQESRVFAAWRAFEAAKLSLRGLLAGNISQAATDLRSLIGCGPLWPLHLLRGIRLRNAVRKSERYSPFG
jgi:glycosyltransferase involved in cell wall biosynthesis